MGEIVIQVVIKPGRFYLNSYPTNTKTIYREASVTGIVKNALSASLGIFLRNFI